MTPRSALPQSAQKTLHGERESAASWVRKHIRKVFFDLRARFSGASNRLDAG